MAFFSRLFSKQTRAIAKSPASAATRNKDDLDRNESGSELLPVSSHVAHRAALDVADMADRYAVRGRGGREFRPPVKKTTSLERTLMEARLSTARLSSTSQTSDSGATVDEPLQLLYTRIRQVHKGRDATILEAFERKTGKGVIIKAYQKSSLTATKRERIDREVEVLRAMDGSPHVVQLLRTLEDSTFIYTILDSYEGSTLIEVVDNSRGKLPEERCVKEVALPLLQAVAALHSQGVVHRCLQPEHVFCCSGGSIRLLDMLHSAFKREQCLNSRVGALEYMAPEVLDKPRAEDVFHEVLFNGMAEEELPQYDEKVDIWAVGALLYEALVGMQPFLADNAMEMIEVQRRALAPSAWAADGAGGSKGGVAHLIAQHTGLSAEAQSFLTQALQLDASLRPSAEQLLQHPWLAAAREGVVPPTTARSRMMRPASYQQLQNLASTSGSSSSGGGPAQQHQQRPGVVGTPGQQHPSPQGAPRVPTAAAVAAVAAASLQAARPSPLSRADMPPLQAAPQELVRKSHSELTPAGAATLAAPAASWASSSLFAPTAMAPPSVPSTPAVHARNASGSSGTAVHTPAGAAPAAGAGGAAASWATSSLFTTTPVPGGSRQPECTA